MLQDCKYYYLLGVLHLIFHTQWCVLNIKIFNSKGVLKNEDEEIHDDGDGSNYDV